MKNSKVESYKLAFKSVISFPKFSTAYPQIPIIILKCHFTKVIAKKLNLEM